MKREGRPGRKADSGRPSVCSRADQVRRGTDGGRAAAAAPAAAIAAGRKTGERRAHHDGRMGRNVGP